MKTRIYLLLLSSLFLNTSCIRTLDSRLSQSLEGRVASIKSILNLKCVLKTGERSDRKVYRSDAPDFYLDNKKGYRDYTPVQEGTITYKGFDSKGKSKTDYINNFGYVAIKSVEERSSSKEDVASLIPNINCSNLISAEHHPLFIGRSYYNYDIRFQVIGDYIRILAVAPAKDIPYQALSYSLKLKNGLYAMPIGGYSANLGYIEEVVNSDWEATNILTLRTIPVQKRKGYSTHTSPLGIVSSYPNKEDGVPAKYVEISGAFKNFKNLLESGKKQDVYPKSLFQGEWHYRQVTVSNSLSQPGNPQTGREIGYDSQFAIASKINVVLKDNFLIGYTQNVEKISGEDVSPTNRDRWVFKIPVEHLDYWASQSGKDLNAGLQEVTNDTQSIHKRPFVRVNFNQASTPFLNILNNRGIFLSSRLNEITISEDYLSFSLKDDVHQNTMQFSLLRVRKNPNYKPIYMTQKMFELFPAMSSQKRFDGVEKYTWSDEYQKSQPIKLFDLSRPIIYHFSNLSSNIQSVRDMGREAINIWNQAFIKAGVSCPQPGCVVLDETKDVDVGDLRYNIMNLLTPNDIDKGSLVGYGPSVSDQDTGEIISATTNAYLHMYNGYLKRAIYNYIKTKGVSIPSYNTNYSQANQNISGMNGYLKNAFLSGHSLTKLFLPSYMVNSWDSKGQSYHIDPNSSPMQLKPIYGLDIKNGQVEYVTSVKDVLKSKEDRDTLAFKYQMLTGAEPSSDMSLDDMYESISQAKPTNLHDCALRDGYLPSGDSIYQVIDKLCKQELKGIIESGEYYTVKKQSLHKKVAWLKKQSQQEDFQSGIKTCAEKILPLMYFSVLLHEQGHNVAMMHNFKASNDDKNIIPMSDYDYKYIFSNLNEGELDAIKDAPHAGSSVMDYLSTSAFAFNPGGYDVAFLRFFYGGQIEHRDGSLISLDLSSKKGSDELNSIPYPQLKRYKVCMDWDATYGSDVFCKRFDVGYTAEEIVNNYYNEYIGKGLSLEVNGSNPSNPPSSIINTSIFYFVTSTVGIYQEWRYELAKHLKTDDPLLLTNINRDEYLKQVQDLVSNNEYLADLFKARNKIVSTYIELLFDLHDKYCLIKNQNRGDNLELVSFQELHGFLSDDLNLGVDISSCDDMKNILGLSGRVVVAEKGMSLYPGRFATNPYPLRQAHHRIDYRGSLVYRVASFIGLIVTPYSRKNNSFVGLMDEPDIRQDIHSRLLERMLKGTKVSDEIQSPVYGQTTHKSTDTYFPNFSSEEWLWNLVSFPLFRRSVSPVNNIKSTLGFLDELVYMQPALKEKLNAGSFLGSGIIQYNTFRKQGAYLIEGSTELNQFSTSIILQPITRASERGSLLIQGIRGNELKRSFIKFSELHHKYFVKESHSTSRDIGYKDFLAKAVASVNSLYGDSNPYVSLMTFTSLFDHLEKEGDQDHIHSVLQTLQVATILQFKVQEIFDKKCKSLKLNECPQLSASAIRNSDYKELFSDGKQLVSDEIKKISSRIEDYMDSIKLEKKPYVEFTLIKPSIEKLYKNMHEGKALKTKSYIDLIKNLYILNLFSKIESDTNVKLVSLFNDMMEHLNEEDQSSLQGRVDSLKLDINIINMLKIFSGNKFIKEIFLRNLHYFSNIKLPIQNIAEVPDKDHGSPGILFSPGKTHTLANYMENSNSNPTEMSIGTLNYISTYISIFNRWDGDQYKLNPEQENSDNVLNFSDLYHIIGSIYEFFVLNTNVNAFFTTLLDQTVGPTLKTSFLDVWAVTTGGVQNGMSFLERENENNSKLTGFFNRQQSEELISQYNIIYKSIAPSLLLYNSFSDNGGANQGPLNSLQHSLPEKWNALRDQSNTTVQ